MDILQGKLGHSSLDLVNLYQFPDSYTMNRKNPIEARGGVWTQLDTLLHSIARRNLMVVAGDFNCPLTPKNDKSTPDENLELRELIKKYHLGSVRGQTNAPTFFGAQGNSCIDHVLLPQAQMDAQCRRGRTVPNFPVAAWRTIRDHVPVISSLPLQWKCWFHRPPQTHRFPS